MSVIGGCTGGWKRDDISGRGASRDELRQELESLESRMDTKWDAKLSVLGFELRTEMYKMKADLLHQTNEQTKTLYRTIVVANSAMVFAVAGLAFGQPAWPETFTQCALTLHRAAVPRS